MGKMNCFSGLLGGKRKALMGKNKGAYAKKAGYGNDYCPKVKPVEFMDMADTVADDDVSFGRRRDDSVPPASACDSRLVVHAAAAELAHHATAENDDGDKSGAAVGSSGYSSDGTRDDDAKSAEPDDDDAELSSPAGRMSPPPSSPKLKRSCSNIETTTTTRSRSVPAGSGSGSDLLPPAKSRSYNDLKTLPPPGRSTGAGVAVDASPAAASFRTSCSADRVMLKKRSSRQVLPSRSRKLWRQMFLWSHRSSLHRPSPAMPTLPPPPSPGKKEAARRQNDGYTSDTLGAVTAADAKNKGVAVAVEEDDDDPVPDQWVAFSFSAAASPLDRVSAWVNSLGNGSFHAVDEDDDATGHGGGDTSRPPRQRCSEIVEELPTTTTTTTTTTTAGGGKRHPPAKPRRAAADDAAAQASGGVVQTLNAVSSVAHIAGMGLKAVPMIAAFSTLRAVNLSGNMIVQITAGSLPKGLHSLDLSRNKIAIIEGLRELTRLRVLNLSYNRISRIGHGLSSCTAIRELYLAGNKIGEVEGLHRLLKLAVLDVSFNKISTAKSLGQLVANYGSLRAVNLLGNPVQANAGDDTLRKAVSGLLPRIEYLNKQAVKPQRAREVAKDSVAQAALGNAGGGNSRRRLARRLSQSPGAGGGSSAKADRRGRDGNGNGSRRGTGSRSRSVTRPQSSSLPRR